MWVMFWQLLLVVLAGAAAAAIPIPFTETAIIAALGAGHLDPLPVALAATTGAVLGSAGLWVLGRFFAHYRSHPRFPIKAEKFEKYSLWFQRFGVWTLLMTWTPGLGEVLTLIAGVFRTPFVLSMVLVCLGKGVRFALFTYAVALGLPWALKLFHIQQ